VTVGIGALSEHGDMVIMGTDMRATFPRLATAHDECAKAFLMNRPTLFGVAVAGTLRVAHPFVDFLSFYLERLAKESKEDGKQITRQEVESVIDLSRFRIFRRLVDWELKMSYGMSLDEWKSGKVPGTGKMNRLVLEAGKTLMKATDLPMEALIAGFIDGGDLVCYKASRKRHLEVVTAPGFQVIGTGGELAMNHLNRCEQTPEHSFARTLLHVAEALEEARKEPHGTVGKPAWIFAISKSGEAAYIKPDHPALREWRRVYKNRNSTTSLQNCKLSDILAKGMSKPLIVQTSKTAQ